MDQASVNPLVKPIATVAFRRITFAKKAPKPLPLGASTAGRSTRWLIMPATRASCSATISDAADRNPCLRVPTARWTHRRERQWVAVRLEGDLALVQQLLGNSFRGVKDALSRDGGISAGAPRRPFGTSFGPSNDFTAEPPSSIQPAFQADLSPAGFGSVRMVTTTSATSATTGVLGLPCHRRGGCQATGRW